MKTLDVMVTVRCANEWYSHMRFALMLRVAWELYLRQGKDGNFGTHHQ